MTGFTGFEPEAIEFLATLGAKKADWFKAHKEDYERLVVGPSRAFVSALGAELVSSISDEIDFGPRTNHSIAPINNDLRFSPGKPPYKDHLLLRFWEGPNKKAAPTLFVRIAPSGIGFATGAAFDDLSRWREAVAAESGEELADAIARLVRSTKAEVVGQTLKRVPSPYPADHPREGLLRHKMIQVRWQEKPRASLSRPDFVAWCVKRLERCAEIHCWLVRELT